jgi:hypothetical protein
MAIASNGDRAAGETGDEAVVLRERTFASVEPGAWDRFVIAAGGSFLGSWRVVRAHRLRAPVRVFELFVTAPTGSARKVAQCALAVGRGRARFLDRLHVDPAGRHLWDRCWPSIVERCGPGTYDYGSPWNHEDPRPLVLARPLVAERVLDEPFQVDRVAFGAWADFAAYRRSVSENIRRDYRKAAAASASVVTRYGLAALPELVGFTRLRRQTMRRKGEPYSDVADWARHALKLACLGPSAFLATARTHGRCRAGFFGVRFGGNVYYLAGGTGDDAHGFGSYLFLTLLERWFTEHPGGNLYLGTYPGAWDPQTYTGGNLLYRRKLRASAVRGVRFSVTLGPPPAGPPPAQPGATARSAER